MVLILKSLPHKSIYLAKKTNNTFHTVFKNSNKCYDERRHNKDNFINNVTHTRWHKKHNTAGLTGNGVRSLSHALAHASLLLDVRIIARLDLALANFFQSMVSFNNRPFPLESAVWFPLIKIYVFN